MEPWILLGGAMVSLAGVLVLGRSAEEGRKEYREMEEREALKLERRKDAEAKRMQAGSWSDWDEFTRIRRTQPGVIEFCNSSPPCMLAAIILFLAALDTAFFGHLFPRLGLEAGALVIVVCVALFLISSGTVIDSIRRKITRWRGWAMKPLVRYQLDPAGIESLTIEKKSGPKPGSNRTGRSVRYPLYLVTKQGRRILLKPCPDISEARDLGMEVSQYLGVPNVDNSGAGPATKKKPPRKKPGAGMALQLHPGSGDMENYAQEHIVEIAEMQFPDNTGLEWIIHGFEHRDDFTYVEVEPVPQEVGYPRFKFVLTPARAGGAVAIATYCLEDNIYKLLSYTPGYGDQLPKQLESKGAA